MLVLGGQLDNLFLFNLLGFDGLLLGCGRADDCIGV